MLKILLDTGLTSTPDIVGVIVILVIIILALTSIFFPETKDYDKFK